MICSSKCRRSVTLSTKPDPTNVKKVIHTSIPLLPPPPLFLHLIFSLHTLSLHTLPLLNKHSLLRTPQLAIQPTPINKLLMRPTLRHPTLTQHDNNIRVVNSAKAMRDKDRSAFLFSNEGVDVGEEGLLCVGV